MVVSKNTRRKFSIIMHPRQFQSLVIRSLELFLLSNRHSCFLKDIPLINTTLAITCKYQRMRTMNGYWKQLKILVMRKQEEERQRINQSITRNHEKSREIKILHIHSITYMVVNIHCIQITMIEKKGTVVDHGKETTTIIAFTNIGFYYHMISMNKWQWTYLCRQGQ